MNKNNNKLFIIMFFIIVLPIFNGCVDKVTFNKPIVISENGASISSADSNNYTVNKSDTIVAMPFTFGDYLSFYWESNNPDTGNFSSYHKSACINYTNYDDMKYEAQLTIKSTNKYSRKLKIVAYKQKDCKGESKEFISPTVSYKATSPTSDCSFASGGNIYKSVCDKSNGGYKNIGTQGHSTSTCNCYAKAYALRMLGIANKNPNVSNPTECWDSSWAGDYYASDEGDWVKHSYDYNVFKLVREELEKGYPTMVLVYNSDGGTHWLLVTAIKESALEKSYTSLDYNDFWVIDSVGDSYEPNVNEDPEESNWQTLITEANGNANNRKLRKGPDTNKYETVQYDK